MATLDITDDAATEIKARIAADQGAIGLRVGTETYGCSGLGYKLDLVHEPGETDEVIETKGVKLYVDRKALLVVMGTTIGWEDTMFNTGFTFSNPNETGRCGCGESFTVAGEG